MKIDAFVAVSLLDVCVMVVSVASVRLYIYLFVTLFLFCYFAPLTFFVNKFALLNCFI